MNAKRVKCTECDALILLTTAEKNHGLCAQCVKISPDEKARRKAFKQKLNSGELWIPTEEELASARNSLKTKIIEWNIEPDFYEDSPEKSIKQIINEAKQMQSGNVFLVADGSCRVNLSFNEKLGVVEYQDEKEDDYLYAYTPQNLQEQVEEAFHIYQACPCCGVGMLCYPSRTHMPRELAFSIFEKVLMNSQHRDVEWLALGDISYVSIGRG